MLEVKLKLLVFFFVLLVMQKSKQREKREQDSSCVYKRSKSMKQLRNNKYIKNEQIKRKQTCSVYFVKVLKSQ